MFFLTQAQKATKLYNGNISETHWKTASDNVFRMYSYQYDHLNRLLEGNYKKEGGNFRDSYLEHLSYDKNGNIQSLLRHGDSDANDYEFVIDKLEYTYHPENQNQLMKVFDSTNSPQGFKDDTDGIDEDLEDDYEYDANGNLTKDDNKKIDKIKYNHLNLPVLIYFANGSKISYLYNATGQKHNKVVTSSETTTTDYLAGFQYHNGSLKHFPHAEGYVNVVDREFKYVYNYTDHLGNIRLSYSDANGNNRIEQEEILEENHYYPFGLKHTAYNTNERQFVRNEEIDQLILRMFPRFAGDGSYNYKYNGKEYQDELGLNVTAMDYRQYDNAIGRFNSIDVLSELFVDYSPYVFVLNNPVIFNDPTGLCPECEENVKDPKAGQSYTSTGGGVYTFGDNGWVRDDGVLNEVILIGTRPNTSSENNEELYERDSGSVGQPGTIESMIPVWGSGRSAIDHFQNGNYWSGTGYTLLAISDIFLVKSIATGIAKGGIAAFGKNYSTWSSWRKFYGKENFAESGQHLHHWLLRRNGQKSGTGFAWKLKNQMWNLMPMKSPAFHTSIHGKGINAFNVFQRAYYGSPIWFQTGIISTVGHSLQLRGINTNEEVNETE